MRFHVHICRRYRQASSLERVGCGWRRSPARRSLSPHAGPSRSSQGSAQPSGRTCRRGAAGRSL